MTGHVISHVIPGQGECASDLCYQSSPMMRGAASLPPGTGSGRICPSPIHSATQSEMTGLTLTACTGEKKLYLSLNHNIARNFS